MNKHNYLTFLEGDLKIMQFVFAQREHNIIIYKGHPILGTNCYFKGILQKGKLAENVLTLRPSNI